MAVPLSHSAQLVLNFPSHEHALIAMQSLAVDEELNPQRIQKTFTISGNSLYLNIVATDMKMIRVSLSSFLDMALVVAKSLHEFSE